MSVRVMTAVWSIQLPDSEKIVLLALADCANDEGFCWPSMATLATKCSKSDRTVQACIKALVADGHLTRKEVPGKGCSYVVHPRSDFTPEAISPRSEGNQPPKPVRDTPEAASDKPSKNHKKPSSKEMFVVPDWVPDEPWTAYDEMRNGMKHKWPWTDYGRKCAIAELERLKCDGHDPVKVLNLAVMRGYRGVFGNEDTKGYSGGGAEWSAAKRAEYLARLETR